MRAVKRALDPDGADEPGSAARSRLIIHRGASREFSIQTLRKFATPLRREAGRSGQGKDERETGPAGERRRSGP